MTIPQETDVLIVGGGPAGLSAARTCEEYGIDYLVVEGRELGGQLLWTHNIIQDYVGVNDMRGPTFLERMISAQGRLAHCSPYIVQKLNLDTRTAIIAPYNTGTRRGVQAGIRESLTARTVRYKGVLLATGCQPRKLGIPGEDLEQVHGPYFSTTEHADSFAGKSLVVVGGGDRAFEGAVRCAQAGAMVTIIHRGKDLRAKAEFVEEAYAHPRIDVRLQTQLVKIVECTALPRTTHTGTPALPPVNVHLIAEPGGKHCAIECDAVFIRIGVEPNTDLVKGVVRRSPDGFVEVDGFGRTSEPAIYAAGDVCVPTWAARLQAAIASGSTAVRAMRQDGIV